LTPIEKFADATTPSRACAAAARSVGAMSPQPVVPMTTGIRISTYRGKLVFSASAVEKSIATSAGAQPCPSTSTRPATVIPAPAASSSTSLPIFP